MCIHIILAVLKKNGGLRRDTESVCKNKERIRKENSYYYLFGKCIYLYIDFTGNAGYSKILVNANYSKIVESYRMYIWMRPDLSFKLWPVSVLISDVDFYKWTLCSGVKLVHFKTEKSPFRYIFAFWDRQFKRFIQVLLMKNLPTAKERKRKRHTERQRKRERDTTGFHNAPCSSFFPAVTELYFVSLSHSGGLSLVLHQQWRMLRLRIS